MRGIEINDLPERYRKQAAQQLAPTIHVPGPAANVEPDNRNALSGPKEAPRLHGPVVIVLREYRNRLTDYGGSSEKYIVDAIVSAKILTDDSLTFVSKIEKKQFKTERGEPEKTIVEIWGT